MHSFDTKREFENAVNRWLAETSMKHGKPAAPALDFDIIDVTPDYWLVSQFRALGETLDIRVRATEFLPPECCSGALAGGH